MINPLRPKSEFAKHVLTLMTGTTVAQAIPIVMSPILTRLFSPEDFGAYAVYLSIILILAPISMLRYEQAIVIAKGVRNAQKMYVASFYLLCIMSVLIALGMMTLGHMMARFDFLLMALSAVAIFFVGYLNLHVSYLTYVKRYKPISTTMIAGSLSNAVLNLGVGLVVHTPLVLLANMMASKLIASIYVVRLNVKLMGRKVGKQGIFEALKAYSDMPKYSTPEALIGALNSYALLVVLSLYVDPVVAGGYFLIQRVLGVPISIFSSSYSKVFFKAFSTSREQSKYLLDAWKKLAMVAIPMGILIYVSVPLLLGVVFGAQWGFAAEISQILLPFYVIHFIFAATGTAHITLRLQHVALIFSIVSLVARGVIFVWVLPQDNALMMIQWIVIYDIAQVIVMNLYAWKKATRLRV